jgi:hypothetical protein
VDSRKALDSEAAIKTAHSARGKVKVQRGFFRLDGMAISGESNYTQGNIASQPPSQKLSAALKMASTFLSQRRFDV